MPRWRSALSRLNVRLWQGNPFWRSPLQTRSGVQGWLEPQLQTEPELLGVYSLPETRHYNKKVLGISGTTSSLMARCGAP